MDRLSQLFEQLPLSEVTRVVRRTVFGALIVGAVAFGISLALSHPLVGLGVCVGLALGLANIRLVSRTVAKVNASGTAHPRRALASSTLVRLGVTTAVVVGLAFASVSLGISSAGGIALFYFLLLVSLVRSLFAQGTTGVTL
ncbi:MAG: ATP synthase subunit I [Acidimicrobiales bacterium]